MLDLLYAKDVLTFSDYESVRETKPGYSRKDRVSFGQGLGFQSFPVPFFLQFHGAICLELTAVQNVPTLFLFKFHLKTFLFAQAFHSNLVLCLKKGGVSVYGLLNVDGCFWIGRGQGGVR